MDPVLIVSATALAMIAVERLAPAVQQPRVPYWLPRVIALNLAQAGVVYLGSQTWDRWLPGLRLWDGEAYGTGAGIAFGYLAITFVYYWWHRARHEIGFLWRWL